MRALVVFLAACSSAPRATEAPAGKEKVLPYKVITVTRPSGWGELRIAPDGTRRTHFEFNDRGRGPKLDTELRLDASGRPRSYRATGKAYLGQVIDERLEERDGKLAWKSKNEQGEASAGSGFYVVWNGDLHTELASAVVRAPNHRVKLLPAGEAWLEADNVVTVDGRKLHQVAIAGLDFTPAVMWLDEDLEFFAIASSWMSIVRSGAEASLPKLLEADRAWRAVRSTEQVKKLAHKPPAAGLAITNANMFDAEKKLVVPDRTVIVVGDKITAVGDAKTKIPDGAHVIDARGKTLLPGLWDMHVHITSGEGVQNLAGGITTARDLGNDTTELSALIARIEGGTELGPTILRSGFIDGPGKLAAPTGTLVATQEEAKAAVAKFAELGAVQIKMYSSLDPALVPVIAKAAHERGMRVSGHVPNTMTAVQAVEAGFDEIQHANFLFLNFLAGPNDDTRSPIRFTLVAQKAASVDLAGPEVRAFLDLLAKRRTVIDPTLAIFETMFTNAPGEMMPSFVPYVGRLPATVERGVRGAGLEATPEKRQTYKASFAAMLKLVKLAFDRGIPIVAGTDGGAFITFARELELYVQAGLPAPEVLAIATIGSARVMGKDREVGSIAVGKRADLVLVDGDPTKDISTIRNTATVVARGVVYDPDELNAAFGISKRR